MNGRHFGCITGLCGRAPLPDGRGSVRMLAVAVLMATAGMAWADVGVLIPSTLKQPDARVLALDEMSIHVTIDNGWAKVQIREIFSNRAGKPIEGNYVFALPGGSTVSDFAVWDDATRIPGVILERKRAEEIYNDIRMQALDPGLLQMGERDADEARRSSIFSARVVPIPAYGTKRIEIEYQERIAVERGESLFAIPLRPDVYRAQTAGRLTIDVDVKNTHAMHGFEFVSKAFPMKMAEQSGTAVKASFDARSVLLTEDFALKYGLDASKDSLEVLAYRDGNDAGFFEASALMALPSAAAAVAATPTASRTVVALFDTSLSMQWEKLERSFRALESLVRSLKPGDRFNVLLYNDKVDSFSAAPVEATPEAVEKALAFVRASRLRGGTNVQAALEAGLAQGFANDPYIVVIGDLGATRGILQNGKLAEWYAEKWKALADAARPRTYVFAVGDDANLPLGKMLARNHGVLEAVRSTEPIDFKLNAFLAKIGRRPVENLTLTTAPVGNFDFVYPAEETVFPGSMQTWVGEYRKPGQATFAAGGIRKTVALPAQNTEHEHLPRAWAQARVNALLEKIERDGEDQASIDEIIRLARKYKFVTPYTSFLAAPRALLRPRLIRPGDPVLRVKTDESIRSVVAMFPFGLVKELRYLKDEDTWQTRFLAPKDLTDGTYSVRLILRDQQGRVFRESKTFVIASQPPTVRVKLERRQFHRGEAMKIRVSASDTTRTIVARMYGAPPVFLKWNAELGSNGGEMMIPVSMPAGRYKLTVTAEDFAHNIGSGEVDVEILP
jgi:Ca-activated chloride channel family protein